MCISFFLVFFYFSLIRDLVSFFLLCSRARVVNKSELYNYAERRFGPSDSILSSSQKKKKNYASFAFAAGSKFGPVRVLLHRVAQTDGHGEIRKPAKRRTINFSLGQRIIRSGSNLFGKKI